MTAAAAAPVLWVAAAGVPLLLAAGFARARWRTALAAATPWAPLPALLAALWPGRPAAIDLDQVLLGARLGVDEVGRTFLFFTAVLWMVSGWFAQGYLASDRRAARFHVFWLLSLAGNLALALAQDMLSFYAGFALMSFAAYGLVIHSGEAEALHAGRIYLALVVLGELLLFAGLGMLAHAAGGVAFERLAGRPPSGLAALFVLAGFGIKAGALPLHVWLPLAHPAAPVPASAVLSGAMIKAGLLGWLRFLPPAAPGVAEWSGLLIAAGATAAFFGAVAGVAQSNAKTVLAYSSISQMGFMTVGAGAALLGPEAAPGAVAAVALYALHHGLAKGALFLAVGLAGEAATAVRRRGLHAGALLAALALAGAPWTSGAVAKTALKGSLALLPPPWQPWLGRLLPLAAVGTTLLMARFLFLLRGTPADQRRPCAAMWHSWVVLLVAVSAGAWLWPGTGAAARDALRGSNLWTLSWPVLAGTVAAAAAAWTLRHRPGSRWPRVPAGDLLAGVEWLAAAVRRGWPTDALHTLADRGAEAVAARRAAAAGAAARWLSGAMETRLRAWPNVGFLLLLLAGALLAAVAV